MVLKKKILQLFFIIIGCNTTLASTNNDDYFNNYIDALINKDYSLAKKIADQITYNDLKNQSDQLVQILYEAGQKKINLIKPTNNKNQAVYKLSEGYYLLYTNPYTTQPFESVLEAYKLSVKHHNKKLQILSLIAIQDVYNYEISQTNNDRLLYLKKLELIQSNQSEQFHYKINLLLYNLQNVFYKVELNKKFIDDFEILMASFSKNHTFCPIYYSTVGVLHEAFGNLDKAIEFHEKAIILSAKKPFLKHIKFRSNIRLSEIYRKLANYNKAIDYINLAKVFINQSDTLRGKYYINLYSSYNYAGDKDYKKAYSSLKKANEQNIKLDYKKNTEQISTLNVKYQTTEKEKQILIEQQQKKKNRNIAFTLGALLLFGSILFFLIQKSTKRKQLLAVQEKELETQKLTTVLKEQELTAIDAMIEGQEKERQRIANDLHDDLGGLMANVKLHFNALKDKNSPELFDKTNILIDEAYQKVRSVAHAKNSGVIAKQGLLKAVHNMAEKISGSNKIDINVLDYGLENRLENSLELTIFRIIQELITNVIKHAEATETTIHITNHEDSLNIMVEDNGKGFNTKKIAKKSGMGIHSIDKRIENLGGTVTIESELKKGTTVIIDLPL